MFRVTGADGFAGIAAPEVAAVCLAVLDFGAEQPVATKATTATADAMYVILRTSIERSFLYLNLDVGV